MRTNKDSLSALLAASILICASGLPAAVDSGSDGSDGSLDIAGDQGMIVVSKGGLDADDDGIFHFTTINIGSGTTARFTKAEFGPRPLIFLASGDVIIDGVMDIKGEDGKTIASNPGKVPARGGPGGFDGGISVVSGAGNSATSGEGPGGGKANQSLNGGAASGGHRFVGNDAQVPDGKGAAYGNSLQQPPVGGSGGGGYVSSHSGGTDGGAGGGAVLLASSGTVAVAGEIVAKGGGGQTGGAGSGGGIRIVAQRIEGGGQLDATGGSYAFGQGSVGRVRLEAEDYAFVGTVNPLATQSFPRPILFPESGPSIRLVTVDGVDVAEDPTGSFAMPDVTIDNGGEVTLGLEASNIPVGTVIDLRLVGGEGANIDVMSTPLAGTFDDSTATAAITIPTGFSRFYLTASW